LAQNRFFKANHLNCVLTLYPVKAHGVLLFVDYSVGVLAASTILKLTKADKPNEYEQDRKT